jgi:hypothetical protein
MEKQYDTNHVVVQNSKQQSIQKILQYPIAKKLGLVTEDLEPYWIEFRLMSNKRNFLDIEGLKSLLYTLNVGIYFVFYL